MEIGNLFEGLSILFGLITAFLAFLLGKQTRLYEEKITIYSELMYLLEDILNIGKLSKEDVIKIYNELNKLIAKSYFFTNKIVYQQLLDFIKSFEEYGKNNSVGTSRVLYEAKTLAEVLKIDSQVFRVLTKTKVLQLKDRFIKEGGNQ
ncbi:hypothetical protein [Streptococcus suis]|uniref:Uncharacterized protein n=1 Tax=Streptococcus suis TaxID=1307 RepID=A0A0Z8LL75_STRSU|nr:hypothetical protein [Streptococcus suis]NQG28187.1 hypothetical protein [Streptococcus suis]NQH66715.1 hypothetical protein [Streptococcus suis]CYV19096.1 Uncharacterised protein [Streptococcus suis]CYV92666.1 Uncharacterised protein [Streptococcus suis]